MKPIYCLSLKRQAAFSFQHWVHPPASCVKFSNTYLHVCMSFQLYAKNAKLCDTELVYLLSHCTSTHQLSSVTRV